MICRSLPQFAAVSPTPNPGAAPECRSSGRGYGGYIVRHFFTSLARWSAAVRTTWGGRPMPAFNLIPAGELVRLADQARAACAGTNVEPERFTAWLLDQGDVDWLTPAADRRWAEIIHERGSFPE